MGGELPGAWVFVHEHAPQGQKNTYIGFFKRFCSFWDFAWEFGLYWDLHGF
ncbi:hypothetical protein AOH359_10790 [Helicobacter pylori]